MKKNKLTLAILLTSVSLVVAGAVFANSNLPEMRIQLGAGEKQTYQYIKTDFRLGEAPEISGTVDSSSFSIIEDSGIFSSPSSDYNLVFCEHNLSTGFKIVNEGIFGIEDNVREYSEEHDYIRTIQIKFDIDVLGDRDIVNLGTNTYAMFNLYYDDDGQDVIREYKAVPKYSLEQSSISFDVDSGKNDFDYQGLENTDIYKIILKTISVEYSCSN